MAARSNGPQREVPRQNARYVLLGAPKEKPTHYVEHLRRKTGGKGLTKPCLGKAECPADWHRYAVKSRGYAPAFHEEVTVIQKVIWNPAAQATIAELTAAKKPLREVRTIAREKHGWISRTVPEEERRRRIVVLDLHCDLLTELEVLVIEADRDWRGLAVRCRRASETELWECEIELELVAEPLPEWFDVDPILERIWNAKPRDVQPRVIKFPGSETG